ncbi:hypothetical protein E2C01_074721 [Portunus trituberculatus]|uniref:Transposase IS30-like HTH domain-containing protein n=1 Tax=Portunus trituberculatus TaxID=210409 RepID=A0A5B7I8R9_PORTR|nr:hypothetical protein [Portunus trituberculatus]
MGRCSYNETDPAERLLFMWLWSGGVSFRSIAKHTRRSPTTVRRRDSLKIRDIKDRIRQEDIHNRTNVLLACAGVLS